MKTDISVTGVAEVQAMLAKIDKKTALKATQLWTNWLALESQGEMRKQLPSRFHLRGTQDGFEKAIVVQSATGNKTDAVLKVGGPGYGQSRTQKLGVILSRHEAGEVRTKSDAVYFDARGRAFTAGFFLPASGLRTASTNPPAKLYPTAIGAAMRLTPDSRLILASGTKKGSKKKGNGVSYFANAKGIFQRRHSGFGRAAVELLWSFARTIRTPARLGLFDTARAVTESRALALGSQAIDEALFRSRL